MVNLCSLKIKLLTEQKDCFIQKYFIKLLLQMFVSRFSFSSVMLKLLQRLQVDRLLIAKHFLKNIMFLFYVCNSHISFQNLHYFFNVFILIRMKYFQLIITRTQANHLCFILIFSCSRNTNSSNVSRMRKQVASVCVSPFILTFLSQIFLFCFLQVPEMFYQMQNTNQRSTTKSTQDILFSVNATLYGFHLNFRFQNNAFLDYKSPCNLIVSTIIIV